MSTPEPISDEPPHRIYKNRTIYIRSDIAEQARAAAVGDNHHNAAACAYCNPEYFKNIEEVRKLQAENADLRRQVEELDEKYKAADFWKHWVYPNGATAEQIQNELTDFHRIMENVPKVYDYATGGHLSKPTWSAQTVIASIDEHYERIYTEVDHAEVREIETELTAARLRAAELEEVITALYAWYDKDGSVGGASDVFEENRAILAEGGEG